MKVNSFNTQNRNTPTFQSRNAEIRFADDIMRRVDKEFTRISPTKLNWNSFDRNKLTPLSKRLLVSLNEKLMEIRALRPDSKINPLEYIKMLLLALKTSKLGGCGESGSLGKIGLKVNGIDGLKVKLHGFIKDSPPIDLGHTFVIVNIDKNADLTNYKTFGKKAYIVDPWFGFVDYVPNAFKKYKVAYTNSKKMAKAETIGIIPDDFEISEDALRIINKAFPKLKLDRKY